MGQDTKPDDHMTRRWIVLIAVLGLTPMLMAMRPVDEELLQAADKGDHIQVQALLEKGADVNASNSNGFTPLYLAVMKGHREVVALLLEKGAAVNAASTEGFTPLYVEPR
jgi:ankyrin repeat protein